MKTMIRVLSLSALVLAAVIAVLAFALPSSEFNFSFPQTGQEEQASESTENAVRPPPPVLTATAGDDSITINWQTVDGAVAYEIWVRLEDDQWAQADDGSLSSTTTSFTHSDIVVGQTYHYTGRTVGASSLKSPWASQVFAATFDATVVPTLNATAAAGRIELDWTTVSGAGSHHLIMWTDGQEEWERIGDPLTSTITSYTHSELTGGQSYYYRVRSVSPNGAEGAWSDPVSDVPDDAPTLAAPALTATLTTSQIDLSWNEVTGADTYRLAMFTEGQDDWIRVGDPLTSTVTSYSHSGVTAGQNYYFRITAVISDTVGTWSNTISAVPGTSNTPGLIATDANGQIELTWTAVAGADSYQLITWTSGQDDWVRIGDPLTGTTTSYTHTGATSGQNYYYRISAVVNGAAHEWSGKATALH